MRALTVRPGTAGSAQLEEVPESDSGDGPVLVRTLAIGICGTDVEIVAGRYGWAPPGRDRLILGHESLGRVEQAPAGGPLAPGDLVVGIVRRPDPVPCLACAAGEWDMCRNGLYTERGIKERDGYCAERFRSEPDYADHNRSGTRHAGRPARARQRGCQGLGAHRAHRQPRALASTNRAGHGRRSDRSARGAAGGAARA